MFAVTAGVNSAGTLTVQGTAGADAITLSTVAAANGQPAKIRVVAAGLDVRFTATTVKAVTVNAGGGNDVVNSAAVNKPTVLNGGAGDDTLVSGPNADALNGGDGNDMLDAGTGSDFLSGGAGQDRAVYATRTAGVTVSLDNVANDGAAGEKDDVRSDIEDVAGGSGNDTLTGDKDANLLIGNGGADKLYGLDGNDVLDGGSGDDQLYGQNGNDLLDGGVGTDYLSGGNGTGDGVSYAVRTASVFVSLDGVANDGVAGEKDFVNADVEGIIGGLGNDTLTGNAGDNLIQGGRGNDLINAGGGNDTVYGNAGQDRLYGQGGNDVLYAADGDNEPDYVDGGLGSDTAAVDDGDATFSVEAFF
jgi:Ca2+-binding RTX toxin-like protein